MFHMKVSLVIPYAHKLSEYNGRCRFTHGHNAKVTATWGRMSTDSKGMCEDFYILRKILRDATDIFDHSLIIQGEKLSFGNERVVTVPFNPTAEILSKTTFDRVKSRRIELSKETFLSSVEWEEEDGFSVIYSEPHFGHE